MFPQLPARLQATERQEGLYAMACGILVGCLAEMSEFEKQDVASGLLQASKHVAASKARPGA